MITAGTVRDLAIIDLLASSGMRVGEMMTLNREDINFNERECVVFGKGNKERLVYFDRGQKFTCRIIWMNEMIAIQHSL